MEGTCQGYLKKLCREIQERPTGSAGNRSATTYFHQKVEEFGWKVESTRFDAMDWEEDGADLIVDNLPVQAYPSPYSLGCVVQAELVTAGTIEELIESKPEGKILLLHGDLAREQIIPKNFTFYNPPEHQRIVSELEKKNPAALICATGRNPSLAGGVYPFPLFEDGDFDIPSVYLTEESGRQLLQKKGTAVKLHSRCSRIPGDGYNPIARKGKDHHQRIVISAHIDAKKGTPGAIDNATGVIVLMILAEMLQEYDQQRVIELAAFNGEDYYAASGQKLFLEQNRDKFNDIELNINIDGAGYHQGPTAISLFDVPQAYQGLILETVDDRDEFVQGLPWYQGDHSIFIQQGTPAVAITSKWFLDHMDQGTITHTEQDHPGIVDCQKLIGIADLIKMIILEG